jgi:hypothetical protein
MNIQKVMNKVRDFVKRAENISKRTEIAFLEFEVAAGANDEKEMETIRVKLHQLIDDRLDSQIEIKKLEEEFMKP